MKKDIRYCEYHGKFEAGEWNDWQCPKCHAEIMKFGRFTQTGKLEDAPIDLLARTKDGWRKWRIKN